MKLLVVEPEASGHRFALYTRYIVRGAKKRGWDVGLLTTKDAKSHSSFQLVESELGKSGRVFIMERIPYPERRNPWTLLVWQFRQKRSLQDGFRSACNTWTPDFVFVVTLDYIDKLLSLLGSPFGAAPFGGILLTPTHHHGRLGLRGRRWRDFPAQVLFSALLRVRTLMLLFTIDEPLADEALGKAATGSDEYAKVRFLPDVARADVTNALNSSTRFKSSGQGQVLVYGSLTMRKGIAQLFNALQHGGVSEGTTVMLAGVPDNAIRELLRSSVAEHLRSARRLVERLHFHDDIEERKVFEAADLVWLGYSRFSGMSGVLLLAGAMSRPVIACDEGLIGWYARRFNTGPIVNPDDTNAVASALASVLQDHAAYDSFAKNAWRLSQRHTPEVFMDRLCDSIESVVTTEQA